LSGNLVFLEWFLCGAVYIARPVFRGHEKFFSQKNEPVDGFLLTFPTVFLSVNTGMALCKQCGENDPSKFYNSNKSRCAECTRQRSKDLYHSQSPAERDRQRALQIKWKEDNIFQSRWLQCKDRAARKGLDFTITAEQLQTLWDDQSGLCFYTGAEMTQTRNNNHAVSVDRVDSSQGYTPDNIVLCSHAINLMKGSHTTEQFVALCESVVKR
jgi:hypothetical protein